MNNNNFSLSTKYKRVLIYSDIINHERMLKHFLFWISRLDYDNVSIDYYFSYKNIDNNIFKILNKFSENNNVIFKDMDSNNNFINDSIIDIKDSVIDYAIDNAYDYVFFVRSNIIYHPLSLRELINSNKDIIGNIFWFEKDGEKLPNVYLTGRNDISNSDFSKQEFIDYLSSNSIVSVGGINGSVMISKNAIMSGVNFKNIYNVSYAKGFKALSIRANVLGFDIYVNSKYPCYYISKNSDLDVIENISVNLK